MGVCIVYKKDCRFVRIFRIYIDEPQIYTDLYSLYDGLQIYTDLHGVYEGLQIYTYLESLYERRPDRTIPIYMMALAGAITLSCLPHRVGFF